jgi:hypothetical protein
MTFTDRPSPGPAPRIRSLSLAGLAALGLASLLLSPFAAAQAAASSTASDTPIAASSSSPSAPALAPETSAELSAPLPDAPTADASIAVTPPSNQIAYCPAADFAPRFAYSSSTDFSDLDTSGSAQSQTQSQTQAPSQPPPQTATKPCVEGEQSKRILYIMPNYRAVSADTKLPPLRPRDKFLLAFQDSFDYSSFIYVGMLAGVAMAENSYPEFHQGAEGYGRYYYHAFLDNSIGNFFTEAIVPSVTHEDPRYYTLGRGGLFKRTFYSVSRLLVTRTDAGNRTFNISEIVGNGAAAGVSNLYYPDQTRTWTKTGQKWLIQIGLDGGSNLVKEFWPDVSHALFHKKDCVPGT